MNRISFKNDYSEGCHPSILKALAETNFEQEEGYGEDRFSEKAKALIRERIGKKDTPVYFVPIGTQTNLVVISSVLQSYEYVLAAQTGHIVYIEAGAIEATGHKVVYFPTEADGKVRVKDLESYFEKMKDIHLLLQPRLLYISNSTELGAIYTLEDLETLSDYCRKKGLLIYMDGARLGSALMSVENNLKLSDIARLTDIFYIGGTKAGALLGEAVVIPNTRLATGFEINMKQRGAVLAKGRLMGIQFLELFKDNLYFDLARHANEMAAKIVRALKENGFGFLSPTTTNQIFPILPNSIIAQLEKKYEFYIWKEVDATHSAIRLITCWATKEAAVDALIADLHALAAANKA